MRTAVTLASQSAVRASLLRAAGIPAATVSPGVDEDAVKARMAGADPASVAAALADEKAIAASRGRPGLVIGADQTLDLDGALFDKARSIEEARTRLKQFRGRTHALHAGVALARDGEVIWRELATARLTMRTFSDAFLEYYLGQNEDAALASVGCYQLEGMGIQLFEKIEGDYFAILGLPMLGLLEALRREGALAA